MGKIIQNISCSHGGFNMKTKYKAGLLSLLLGVFCLANCKSDPSTNSGNSNTGGGSQPAGDVTEGYTGGASYVTDAEAKANILGQLEKYAMDTKLTGIPILSDSSTTYYHKRVQLPKGADGKSLGYVQGYGTGLLKEGALDSSVAFDDPDGFSAYHSYLQTFDTQCPTKINGMDGNDTRVSNFYGYISSAFYDLKLVKADNSTESDPRYKNDFEWYPVLAKSTSKNSDGKPLAVDDNGNTLSVSDSGNGLHSKWRIYVKTGEDGLKYATASSKRSKYNGKGVNVEDYVFAMKVLLNQKDAYYRSSSYTSGTNEIKGAASYYNKTKNIGPVAGTHNDSTHEVIDNDSNWKNVGYQAGYDSDAGAYYVDVTYNVPCDRFNAMYQIADANVEPINPEFYGEVTGLDPTTGGGAKGKSFNPKQYGAPNGTNGSEIVDSILSVGPYVLTEWNDSSKVIFARNDEWFERVNDKSIYRIPGVCMRITTQAQNDQYWGVKQFTNGNGSLDSSSKPGNTTEYNSGLDKNGNMIKTPGTSNWKLSVNSCTQDTWNKLFGPQGTIKQHSQASDMWNVKPIMSSSDFLDGCFFAIDREKAATASGMSPAYEFFSDAYYIDPQKKVVYNTTQAHKDAVAEYYPETHGYNSEAAATLFTKAINTLLADGTYKAGDKITLTSLWMSQANIDEFGASVTGDIVNAFNDAAKKVNAANPLTLVIKNEVASNKGDVYTPIGEGKFDFAFGSLTGMNYNPLGMMEVMKSDNSSGFTLNWGADTSANDGKSLIYEGKSWSFDALWESAVYGVTVKDGKVTLPYIYNDKKSGFVQTFDDLTGDLSALQFDLYFDVDKDLQAAANMTINSFQVAITFYGSDETIYSFVVDLVKEKDESDPDKDSKVIFTQTDTAITAKLDIKSLYYWANVVKKSDGTIDPNSEKSEKAQREAANNINDGSIGRNIAMNAYFTVNMEFGGFESIATLNNTYTFIGAAKAE